MNKQELRKYMKSLRANIPDREQKSREICEQIIHSDAYNECQLLLAYLAIGSEVSLSHLIKHAAQTGRQVAVPRILSPHVMEFRMYNENMIEQGAFHTWQPTEEAEQPDYSQNILMITPGLAFTRDGKRLGYGGGYYDTFITWYKKMSATGTSASRPFHPASITICGAAYNEQIIPELPAEERDMCIDAIVTPGGFYDCLCTGNSETY